MEKISEETIKMWEGKYCKIRQIVVHDNGDIFSAYFRRSDMETISMVTKLAKQMKYVQQLHW